MTRIAGLFLALAMSFQLVGADYSPEEKEDRLQVMQETLSSMKKWQGQYRKKQRSYQSRASRVQFKNSTESRQYKELAEDAKKNVNVLQEQIDRLVEQKKALLSSS